MGSDLIWNLAAAAAGRSIFLVGDNAPDDQPGRAALMAAASENKNRR